MPRQKVYDGERVQIQVRLPAELSDRLEAESERRHVSKTYLVERAIELAMPKWEKEKL
jgi:predicted DNA-binding protein